MKIEECRKGRYVAYRPTVGGEPVNWEMPIVGFVEEANFDNLTVHVRIGGDIILRAKPEDLEPVDLNRGQMTIEQLQKESNATAVVKGWWDTERHIGEILALIHSEISEALEEYRNNRVWWDIRVSEDGKPEGFFVELADAVIRIADLFERYGVSMEQVLRQKMDYNKTRPYRHGGKRA